LLSKKPPLSIIRADHRAISRQMHYTKVPEFFFNYLLILLIVIIIRPIARNKRRITNVALLSSDPILIRIPLLTKMEIKNISEGIKNLFIMNFYEL